MGNEFREGFGLMPKMTHVQEKEMREAEAIRRIEEAFRRKVEETRVKADTEIEDSNAFEIDVVTTEEFKQTKKEKPNNSISDQIEAVKKLKELVDDGILTEDEFNTKQKEIMGL